MPSSIDKNDVDISKLFSWNKKYTIEVNKDEYNIYIRLVGDAELNRARVYALRKSAEMRKKLKDENSDERLAYLPSIENLDKDAIINGLTLMNTKKFTAEAMREIKFNLPKEPNSESPLEEKEKYQEEIDSFPKVRDLEIKNYVKERLEEKIKELKAKSKEVLFDEYLKGLVEQVCESEMLTAFREMCTFFGSYKDKEFKHRLLDNFEDFQNLPAEIKSQLIDNYISLEIDFDTLKK